MNAARYKTYRAVSISETVLLCWYRGSINPHLILIPYHRLFPLDISAIPARDSTNPIAPM